MGWPVQHVGGHPHLRFIMAPQRETRVAGKMSFVIVSVNGRRRRRSKARVLEVQQVPGTRSLFPGVAHEVDDANTLDEAVSEGVFILGLFY